MKGSDYWEQFLNTGKIEDYLKFRTEAEGTVRTEERTGEYPDAGTHEGYRDHIKGISGGRI